MTIKIETEMDLYFGKKCAPIGHFSKFRNVFLQSRSSARGCKIGTRRKILTALSAIKAGNYITIRYDRESMERAKVRTYLV